MELKVISIKKHYFFVLRCFEIIFCFFNFINGCLILNFKKFIYFLYPLNWTVPCRISWRTSESIPPKWARSLCGMPRNKWSSTWVRGVLTKTTGKLDVHKHLFVNVKVQSGKMWFNSRTVVTYIIVWLSAVLRIRIN